MVIEKYGKKYRVDDELAPKLEAFCKSMGGISQLLEFMYKDNKDRKNIGPQQFFYKLNKIYKKSPDIFTKLEKTLKTLEKPNYSLLLVISLVTRNIDVGTTIKVDDRGYYDKMMGISDSACFFATEEPYKKYINGCRAFGIPMENTTSQYVTSKSYADKVITNMQSRETWDEMACVYTKSLGFSSNYLDNADAIYRICLNGKKIKDDIEATKSISVGLPNGIEPGANDFWLPGGFTSGGAPEFVFNGIPNTTRYVDMVVKYEFDKPNARIKGTNYTAHRYHRGV